MLFIEFNKRHYARDELVPYGSLGKPPHADMSSLIAGEFVSDSMAALRAPKRTACNRP